MNSLFRVQFIGRKGNRSRSGRKRKGIEADTQKVTKKQDGAEQSKKRSKERNKWKRKEDKRESEKELGSQERLRSSALLQMSLFV